MKFTPLTTLAALVLIGLGGFMAGRVSSSAPTPAAQAVPSETRSSRSVSRATPGADRDVRKSSRDPKPDRAEASSRGERLARLESIVRGENPLERNRALLAFLDKLGPGEFEEAVAHFRSLGITVSRTGEYGLLLTAWAQQDPLAALDYAKANTRGGFAQETILTSWATTDPDAALRWAQSNHEGDGANPHLPAVIRGLVEADPARATDLLTGMPRSEERGEGLDFMLPHLLQQGPAATHAWIAGISDDSLRNGAILRAADQLAAADPAGTASWLLANPGEAAQRRMDDVYRTWADKDPQAALSSLGTLPAGEIRSNALRGVVAEMAGGDPKAALSLMDRYPDEVNDPMIRQFIWNSFGSDPATAASQIARIGDEGQREQMYRRALDNWIERDPATAQAWIQANPVPESVSNHLVRRQTERLLEGP